jgi:transmembrane sensor
MKQGNENNNSDAELNEIDEQATVWFVRLQSGNISQAEKESFLRWLNQADAHREAFNEIGKLWGDADLLQALADTAQKRRIKPRGKNRAAYFMPLAMAACLAVAFWFGGELKIFVQGDYSTRVGERKTVYFNDGSTAMLNTDSAIAVNMDGAQRRVELLKGEAYFEVKPDPSRPFVVQADHSTTRVLGTRFFVHQKSDSDAVKVVSGRVEVSSRNGSKQPSVLRDRESVSADESGLGEVLLMDSALNTSWVKGFLAFDNVPLEQVIDQIRRYRTGVVVYRDSALRGLRINGRINLQMSEDMLKVLSQNLSIKMTYLTDWLVIVG